MATLVNIHKFEGEILDGQQTSSLFNVSSSIVQSSLVLYSQWATVSPLKDYLCFLQSSGNFIWMQRYGTSGQVNFTFYLLEFESSIRVSIGTFTINENLAGINFTVPGGAFDPDRVIALVGNDYRGATDQLQYAMLRWYPLGSTMFRIERDNNESSNAVAAVTGRFNLVELPAGTVAEFKNVTADLASERFTLDNTYDRDKALAFVCHRIPGTTTAATPILVADFVENNEVELKSGAALVGREATIIAAEIPDLVVERGVHDWTSGDTSESISTTDTFPEDESLVCRSNPTLGGTTVSGSFGSGAHNVEHRNDVNDQVDLERLGPLPNSDGTNPWQIAKIVIEPTIIEETIGSGGDYATISAWEAATDIDLVAANEVRIGLLTDAEYQETVIIDGATTDEAHYRQLKAAVGNEYDPITNTGAKIRGSESGGALLTVKNENFFRLQHILVENVGTGENSIAAVFDATADDALVESCVFSVPILVGSTTGTKCLEVAGQDFTGYSCAAFGQASPLSGSRVAKSIHFLSTAFNGLLVNCLADGADSSNFEMDAGATVVLNNCVSIYAARQGYVGGFSTASRNNASEDSSAPGLNPVNNIVAEDCFVKPEDSDYRIRAGGDLDGMGVTITAPPIPTIEVGVFHGDAGAWNIGPYDDRYPVGNARDKFFDQAELWVPTAVVTGDIIAEVDDFLAPDWAVQIPTDQPYRILLTISDIVSFFAPVLELPTVKTKNDAVFIDQPELYIADGIIYQAAEVGFTLAPDEAVFAIDDVKFRTEITLDIIPSFFTPDLHVPDQKIKYLANEELIAGAIFIPGLSGDYFIDFLLEPDFAVFEPLGAAYLVAVDDTDSFFSPALYLPDTRDDRLIEFTLEPDVAVYLPGVAQDLDELPFRLEPDQSVYAPGVDQGFDGNDALLAPDQAVYLPGVKQATEELKLLDVGVGFFLIDDAVEKVELAIQDITSFFAPALYVPGTEGLHDVDFLLEPGAFALVVPSWREIVEELPFRLEPDEGVYVPTALRGEDTLVDPFLAPDQAVYEVANVREKTDGAVFLDPGITLFKLTDVKFLVPELPFRLEPDQSLYLPTIDSSFKVGFTLEPDANAFLLPETREYTDATWFLQPFGAFFLEPTIKELVPEFPFRLEPDQSLYPPASVAQDTDELPFRLEPDESLYAPDFVKEKAVVDVLLAPDVAVYVPVFEGQVGVNVLLAPDEAVYLPSVREETVEQKFIDPGPMFYLIAEIKEEIVLQLTDIPSFFAPAIFSDVGYAVKEPVDFTLAPDRAEYPPSVTEKLALDFRLEPDQSVYAPLDMIERAPAVFVDAAETVQLPTASFLTEEFALLAGGDFYLVDDAKFKTFIDITMVPFFFSPELFLPAEIKFSFPNDVFLDNPDTVRAPTTKELVVVDVTLAPDVTVRPPIFEGEVGVNFTLAPDWAVQVPSTVISRYDVPVTLEPDFTVAIPLAVPTEIGTTVGIPTAEVVPEPVMIVRPTPVSIPAPALVSEHRSKVSNPSFVGIPTEEVVPLPVANAKVGPGSIPPPPPPPPPTAVRPEEGRPDSIETAESVPVPRAVVDGRPGPWLPGGPMQRPGHPYPDMRNLEAERLAWIRRWMS